MFKIIPGISKKILAISITVLFLVSMVFFVSPGKIYAVGGTAAVGDVTVSGTTGAAITSKDVVITLTGDTFTAIAATTDLASWITNLPAGLTAVTAAGAAGGATTVTITIAGTPTAASSAAMAITIPAASLTGVTDLTVTANPAAKFAITGTAAVSVAPLTAEEQASLNLSIIQQVDLYGASNIGFTKMLYDNILGRASDSEGLNDWVTALNDGKITLGSVVYNFVFSKELEPVISSASPEEFITFLYKNVFNREQDSEGYAGWINAMTNGMSKEEVLLHFLDTDEFRNICTMFNLTP